MFVFTNPNPRGTKHAGDCVKRACCIGSGINYHDIEIMLNRFKKETGCSKYNSNGNWKPFVEKVLMGLKMGEDMRFIDCGHRFTVEDFSETYYDTCILRCAGHLVACKKRRLL